MSALSCVSINLWHNASNTEAMVTTIPKRAKKVENMTQSGVSVTNIRAVLKCGLTLY